MSHLSIDIGGTNIRFGYFVDGAMTGSPTKVPQSNTYDEFLNILKIELKNSDFGSASIGVAGSVDKSGSVLKSPNASHLENQNIKNDFYNLFGIEPVVVNDALAASAAEITSPSTEYPYILLTWGTGIGAAKVERVDHRLYLQALEIGHHQIQVSNTQCDCGQQNCIENSIAGKGLKKITGINAIDIPKDHPIWDEVIYQACTLIKNLIMFHPVPIIYIAGGFLENRPWLLDSIQNNLKELITMYPTPKLVRSTHGSASGLMGLYNLTTIDYLLPVYP